MRELKSVRCWRLDCALTAVVVVFDAARRDASLEQGEAHAASSPGRLIFDCDGDCDDDDDDDDEVFIGTHLGHIGHVTTEATFVAVISKMFS